MRVSNLVPERTSVHHLEPLGIKSNDTFPLGKTEQTFSAKCNIMRGIITFYLLIIINIHKETFFHSLEVQTFIRVKHNRNRMWKQNHCLLNEKGLSFVCITAIGNCEWTRWVTSHHEVCWKWAVVVWSVCQHHARVVFLREDAGISQTAWSHLTNEIRGELFLTPPHQSKKSK